MARLGRVLLVLAGAVVLSGCAASRETRPAALTGESVEPQKRETKIVSTRDTRGRVRHRVSHAD